MVFVPALCSSVIVCAAGLGTVLLPLMRRPCAAVPVPLSRPALHSVPWVCLFWTLHTDAIAQEVARGAGLPAGSAVFSRLCVLRGTCVCASCRSHIVLLSLSVTTA